VLRLIEVLVAVLAAIAVIAVVESPSGFGIKALVVVHIFAGDFGAVLVAGVVADAIIGVVEALTAIVVSAVAVAAIGRSLIVESNLETFGIPLLVAVLERADRTHPVLVSVGGLTPVGRVIVVGVIFVAFMLAAALAIAEAAVVPVLARL